ncbi:MAG: hypothetical protein K1X89_14170 [Myxococcaceae bacterium]|nr:hypothetical protein [Myxococcaceae bacterium]
MLRRLMTRRALALLLLAACAKPQSTTPFCRGGEPHVVQTPFFGVGVEGHPVALQFRAQFCLEDPLPETPPRFVVIGPDDAESPFELRDAGFSNLGTEVTVAFTPQKPGTYYVRGDLSGGQGVVQFFVPVARDATKASPTMLPLASAQDCVAAQPFGRSGAVCQRYGMPLLVLEPSLPGGQATLPQAAGMATAGDTVWLANFVGSALEHYRLRDGGFALEGVLPLQSGEGALVDLGTSSDGQAIFSLQQHGTRLVAAVDGGLVATSVLTEMTFGTCLSGDTLAIRGTKGARLQRLDGGDSHEALGGTYFSGCTSGSLWFAGTSSGGVATVGRTGAQLQADGGEAPLQSTSMGQGSFLAGPTHSAPFLVPMNDLTGLSDQGSLWGEVFVPAWTDAGIALEWYGDGVGFFATETQVLKAGDGGLFLYPRP